MDQRPKCKTKAIDVNLHDLGLGSGFLNTTTRAQQQKKIWTSWVSSK